MRIVINDGLKQVAGGGPVITSELRITPQRQAVLAALEAATDHPTAADVFERVRQTVPGIGPATVYRTLALLVSQGLALELSLGDGNAARYDGNTSRHDHLVCSSCGAASDIESALPAQLLRQLTSRTGYAITRYDLQFHGLCPTCQKSEKQEESHG
jgi:Fe2+ or Zn2+ uptake regulation protein